MGDACVPDDDNDGKLDADDQDFPLDPKRCGDSDDDGCDDCSKGVDGLGARSDVKPEDDGEDTDRDGQCDVGDNCDELQNADQIDTDGDEAGDLCDDDDDNAGVPDDGDGAPTDPALCRDVDGDQCDDCAVENDGYGEGDDFDPANDGLDTDSDGTCNVGDDDDDNDGVPDLEDEAAPLDPRACGDSDGDECDDCAVQVDGTGELPDVDPDNDGLDTDGDGECDVGDDDDDNDGVLDADEVEAYRLDPDLCGDEDGDTCDDCVIGVDDFEDAPDKDVFNDGQDTDADGQCDAGDTDDDNDGVLDADELEAERLDPTRCGDEDNDTCDDCGYSDRRDGFGGEGDAFPHDDDRLGADRDKRMIRGNAYRAANDTQDNSGRLRSAYRHSTQLRYRSQTTGFRHLRPLPCDDPDGDLYGDGIGCFGPDQAPGDPDSGGCAADDADGDGLPDCVDTCPDVAGVGQVDTDGDGLGDACDPDDDNDGIDDFTGIWVDAGVYEWGAVGFYPLTDEIHHGAPAFGPCSGGGYDFWVYKDQANRWILEGRGPNTIVGDQLHDWDWPWESTWHNNSHSAAMRVGDNCIRTPNPDQTDTVGDGLGDACDP